VMIAVDPENRVQARLHAVWPLEFLDGYFWWNAGRLSALKDKPGWALGLSRRPYARVCL